VSRISRTFPHHQPTAAASVSRRSHAWQTSSNAGAETNSSSWGRDAALDGEKGSPSQRRRLHSSPLFLAAPQAQATYGPIGSGQTKLSLDKRFVSFLAKDGIKLTASAGAKRKGAAIALPVSAGNMDPMI
jgi:hypothetical protein